MKNWKFAVKPLCAAAALMFASAVSYGQNVSIIAGSTGAYISMSVSPVEPDPITSAAGPCAATDGGGGHGAYHMWSAKSTSPVFAVGVDSNRNAAFPDEPGNVTISWDNSAAPTNICVYLSVDSVIGNRLFFGTYAGGGHATFRFDSSLGTAGDPAIPTATSCLGGTSQGGAGQVAPFLTDDAGLPCTVYTAIQGQQITAAASDIRPEDAEFASQRAAAPCSGGKCFVGGSKEAGLGYGGPANGLPGLAVDSSFTNTSSQVIGYYISGNDPSTGVAVPAYNVFDLGAYPEMVFVGLNRPAAPCATDFAVQTPTNVPSHTLALIYGGNFAPNLNNFSFFSRTTDLDNLTPTQSAADGGAGLNGCPVTILQREITSGTYNTFEWQIPEASGVAVSQEDYSDPTNATPQFPAPAGGCYARPTANPVACSNPLWLPYADGSVRARGIGTGEIVKAADGDTPESCAVGPCPKAPNAIGYAFWTFATYAAADAQNLLRYITVDSVDPLQNNYFAPASAGAGNAVPVVGQFAPCVVLPCRLPMTGVRNGGYRIWNVIRIIQPANVAANTAANAPTAADEALATAVITTGQDQADPTVGNLTDFVPFNDANGHILNVFRSHYNLPNIYQFGSGAAGVGSITAGALLNGTNAFAFGGKPAYADNGGDMAGAVFNDQNDMDVLNDFGVVLTGWRQ